MQYGRSGFDALRESGSQNGLDVAITASRLTKNHQHTVEHLCQCRSCCGCPWGESPTGGNSGAERHTARAAAHGSPDSIGDPVGPPSVPRLRRSPRHMRGRHRKRPRHPHTQFNEAPCRNPRATSQPSHPDERGPAPRSCAGLPSCIGSRSGGS